MKIVVNIFLSAIFCAIFLWQAWSTISKYQAEKTTLQVVFFVKLSYDRVKFSTNYVTVSRLHSMMINIFSFHPLHFVNTTCIINNQEFWKCRNWTHLQNPPAENCFWTEPGQETNCSWMCLTTRWMRPTSSPAPQLEVPGWAHHAASHSCIQIALEVLTQLIHVDININFQFWISVLMMNAD